jgi:hypothetical protein
MISYYTFQDAVDHGLDYLGSNPTDQARRDCVRAILESYRDLANAFNWTYLYTPGRLITSPAYDSSATGATLAYLDSSGTYPRQVTISGDVWPDWAGDGVIRIGTVGYKVDQRISATVLTLDETIKPSADIPALTPFTMYQDSYLLPEDFVAQDQALYELNFGGMDYTHPREWLFENRYVFAQGTPQFFTITGDRKYPGRLLTRIFPWPFQVKTIDFIYKRRPRVLLTQRVVAGTVSVTGSGTALTGVGTAFMPKHVGSVIRLSGNPKPPSSLIMGDNVAVFETTIAAYVSPTSVVLRDPVDATYTASGYVVSDPIDIEQGAMLNAYLRCVEKHLGMARTLKDKPSASKQYDVALGEAKSADSRSFQGRSVGQTGRYRPRFRDMPTGPDEP